MKAVGPYDGYEFRALAEPWTVDTFSFMLGVDEWGATSLWGLTEILTDAADPRSDPTRRSGLPGLPRMHAAVMMPGGIGDDLWMGAVCAGAKRKHPGCHVTAYSRGDTAILLRHPAVDRLVRLGKGKRWNDLAVEMQPYYDLLLDVRYVIKTRYASGLGHDDEQAACEEAWRSWAQEWWDFPAHNDRTAERWGRHLLDLIATTGRLDIGPDDMRLYLEASDTHKTWLLPRPYCVVHCADPVARGTKRWPTEYWREFVRALHGRIHTVQIGRAFEEEIGADVDLRERTNPFEMASVIEGAAMLVDTEGGPAHIARAMGTPALVLFGPTRKEAFGYPENINLQSPYRCTGCAWSWEEWYRVCALGEPEPACMAAITPEMALGAAEPLIRAAEGG
jgi:ADP-heptose:LPS heptosyltransferase